MDQYAGIFATWQKCIFVGRILAVGLFVGRFAKYATFITYVFKYIFFNVLWNYGSCGQFIQGIDRYISNQDLKRSTNGHCMWFLYMVTVLGPHDPSMFIISMSTDTSIEHIALRNHNRTVFEGMTSWTSLSWQIGMKTAFKANYMKSKYFRTFVLKV